MTDQEVSKKIARELLQINAVQLNPANPFRWSSGWWSPIYCDNRITLSFPELRNFLKHAFANKVREAFPEADTLVGVATAGIALGALAADELGLSYAYCRPKPKEHGMKNQLEGRIAENASIVVVEDLISTGGSSLKVVDYLREEGYKVVGMGAVFTYGFQQAEKQFQDAACKWFALSNYHILITEALEMGYITESQLDTLKKWREDPSNWNI